MIGWFLIERDLLFGRIIDLVNFVYQLFIDIILSIFFGEFPNKFFELIFWKFPFRGAFFFFRLIFYLLHFLLLFLFRGMILSIIIWVRFFQLGLWFKLLYFLVHINELGLDDFLLFGLKADLLDVLELEA